MHLRPSLFFVFNHGVQSRVLLAERQTACFDEGGEKIFSALLKINVLIFLRYGVVWFLIFTHDAFRSFLRCLCHIEVCVAVQRLALHFAINLARVGWSVVELQIFFFFFFPELF